MKRLTWGAVAALLGASVVLAVPADNPPSGVSDADFVRLASAAQVAEINFGRLAADQASSPDVKQFAQQMVDDHTKALNELNKTADKAGFTSAKDMDAAHRDQLAKLSGLKGADFDRQYMASQVTDHKDAVALFDGESKNAKNDDLKALAAKLLPTIQHHLDMAQKITSSEAGAKPETTGTDSKTNPPKKDK